MWAAPFFETPRTKHLFVCYSSARAVPQDEAELGQRLSSDALLWPEASARSDGRRRQGGQYRFESEPDRQKLVVAFFRRVDCQADREPGFGHTGRQSQAGDARGAAGGEIADKRGQSRDRRAVEHDRVILPDLRGRERRCQEYHRGDTALAEI